MLKLELHCKGCDYTWYPDKDRWERNPDAVEPDCPNPECQFYGKGFRSRGTPTIWQVKGIIDTEKESI